MGKTSRRTQSETKGNRPKRPEKSRNFRPSWRFGGTCNKTAWQPKMNLVAAQNGSSDTTKLGWNLGGIVAEPWWNVLRNFLAAQNSSATENHRKSETHSAPKLWLLLKTSNFLPSGGKHCTILGIQNCVIMFTFRFCSTVAREKAMENICLPCADSALEAGILKYRIVARPAPCLQSDLACWNWARLMETYMHVTMEEKNASDPSDPLMSNQFPNPGLPHNLVIVEMWVMLLFRFSHSFSPVTFSNTCLASLKQRSVPEQLGWMFFAANT